MEFCFGRYPTPNTKSGNNFGLGSTWEYFKEKLAHRKRVVELATCRALFGMWFAPEEPSTEGYYVELDSIERHLSRGDRRLYKSITQMEVRKLCVHPYVNILFDLPLHNTLILIVGYPMTSGETNRWIAAILSHVYRGATAGPDRSMLHL
jgi:hypothetical protein